MQGETKTIKKQNNHYFPGSKICVFQKQILPDFSVYWRAAKCVENPTIYVLIENSRHDVNRAPWISDIYSIHIPDIIDNSGIRIGKCGFK